VKFIVAANASTKKQLADFASFNVVHPNGSIALGFALCVICSP
jgi:hypothetical protein